MPLRCGCRQPPPSIRSLDFVGNLQFFIQLINWGHQQAQHTQHTRHYSSMGDEGHRSAPGLGPSPIMGDGSLPLPPPPPSPPHGGLPSLPPLPLVRRLTPPLLPAPVSASWLRSSQFSSVVSRQHRVTSA